MILYFVWFWDNKSGTSPLTCRAHTFTGFFFFSLFFFLFSSSLSFLLHSSISDRESRPVLAARASTDDLHVPPPPSTHDPAPPPPSTQDPALAGRASVHRSRPARPCSPLSASPVATSRPPELPRCATRPGIARAGLVVEPAPAILSPLPSPLRRAAA